MLEHRTSGGVELPFENANPAAPAAVRAGLSIPERLAMHLRRDFPLAVLDAGTVMVAFLAILVLRFDGDVPGNYWGNLWSFLPFVIVVHVLGNFLFGLYGQMWRYASVQEARRVVLASVASGATVTLLNSLPRGRSLLPLSVVVFSCLLSLIGFGGVRFQSRLFALRRRSAATERQRVLIVGAGDAGAKVVNDLLKHPSVGLDPVGLLDDDPRKLGLVLHGVPVLGPLSSLPSVAARFEVGHVLLAMPSATSRIVRDVAGLCEKADAVLRVVPSPRETMSGRITVRDIRDLQIEDLLGRQQVEIDLEAVAGILTGRRVLVTGAGGSIGSEIVRQVRDFDPQILVLVDHDETHLHDTLTQVERGADDPCIGVLADVRDRARMASTLMQYRPDVVFHAAAHKHVPVLEAYPQEALFTNVLGTANVADAAVAAGVRQFILISTDKAVRPSSVMGASKRFGEQIIWSVQENGCRFCAVRFGNVLGSRGSVVPTFFRQLAKGGPITVTDPNMTRYFMSVQEAVQLVLQAAAFSKGGEIFTLDMGEPVKVMDLAREIIRLSGRVPGKDVEIQITGVRPGEKLEEDLANEDEEQILSDHPSILVSRPPVPDKAALRGAIRNMENLAREGQNLELLAVMKILADQTFEPVPVEIGL